jgi:hypothetical protein
MDVDILRTAGQIAGIGGLALGVLLIVFRDIIRKNIFPTLPPQEAYRLLRLITLAVWSVAIVGIGAWVYVTRASTPNIEAVSGGIAVGGNVRGSNIITGSTPESGSAVKSK